MTSTRPYLIRAFYEWIADNGLTPYLLVDTKVDGTLVPEQYVDDDKITFNISASATKDLSLGNEEIEFSARFRGRPFFVRIPTRAVLSVYAKETGVGMAFQEAPLEEEGREEAEPPTEKVVSPTPATASLKAVSSKNGLPESRKSDTKPSPPALRIVK